MKFDKLYNQLINEFNEKDQVLTEGVMNKLGTALAASTLATAALMTPMEAAELPPNERINFVNVKNDATQFIGYATNLLKMFEGSIKNKAGNHIAYDDADKTNRWNGKEDINQFIKSCKGKPTIGYGETDLNIVKKGSISDNEALNLLRNQIVKYNNMLVRKFGNAYTRLNYVQKSVLISFYYNLGPYFEAPKMEANLRAGKLKEAAHEFLDCDNQTVIINGKKVKQKVKGLTNRRKAEHDLFIKDL